MRNFYEQKIEQGEVESLKFKVQSLEFKVRSWEFGVRSWKNENYCFMKLESRKKT
jgi:hypothetical protein